MGSRQIRVSEETYELLRRRKGDNETFDDVVGRLIADERDLLAGFGRADEREGESLAETYARRKRRSSERQDRLAAARDEADGDA